ncbi:hypothetical protein EKO27_g554 [Xylaria grammica]|uniref:MACPF-like domain-containing protein n=1 Tax=Xylaria grammica TaxID=363999 RepID=A0A439DJ98_9PEZI|nr:hypothetical protein EKO27_g554 [Xylaria grammica]
MATSNRVPSFRASSIPSKAAPPPATKSQQRKSPSAQIKAVPQPVGRRGPVLKNPPAPAPAPASETDDDTEPIWDERDDQDDDDEVVYNKGHSSTGGSGTPSGSGTLVKVIALSAKADSVSHMPITNLEFPSQSRTSFLTDITLGDVRIKLDAVVRKEATFAFCTNEGAVAASENATLQAYAKTLSEEPFAEDGLFHVYIVRTTEPPSSQESVLLSPPFQIKFIQMGETPSDALNTGSLHSSAFQGKDPSGLPMGELRRMISRMSASPKMHTFCSLDGSAAGDELTLSQYLSLDEEGVHEKEGTPSILIRYRKTDAKVSAAGKVSKFHGASAEVLAAMEQLRPDLNIKDHSAEEFKVDKSGFRVQEELDASRLAPSDANPAKYTSQMDESDWDAVLRNCSLLYGWKINKKTNKIERATTPAFRLKVKNTTLPAIPPQQSVPNTKAIENAPAASASSSTESASSTSGGINTPTSSEMDSEEKTADESKAVAPAELAMVPALAAEDLAGTIPAKLGAIPSYVINDQSKIQITVVSSEFQESMAKNHFDSSSVEASVSGGYAGYSAGVSGGYASENSSKQVNTNKTFTKRMIGSYMFPRVSVFLRPEDLEPTPELKQALLRVQATKDINNLRKLYSTFGHLFCHAVTLGGCLQTTKIVSGSQQSKESEEKEAFKASVGVAFSTPVGIGGSVKGSHENSDSTASFTSQTQTSEAIAFEATGGNSILAANPPAWSSSVADFNNWRVINQNELTPIVDAIAGMAGFQEVKSWFLSAVPKLSQYFVVPESRALHVRFKVATQGDSFNKITGRSEQAYLGVDPSRPPKPVQMKLERLAPETEVRLTHTGFFWFSFDLTLTTRQVDVHKTDAMFFPHCVQAPVLMFPGGKDVGTSEDSRLMQTVWRLEVAQGYSLGPNCLVCVKSCAPVCTSDDKTQQPTELALTVYRNAQGVFMPAITSTDEPCYWRLRRVDDTARGVPQGTQESFKHGEEFRLTWCFADQAGGYRDYYEDTYGRRSFQRPAEVGPTDSLCLKMPYPRFEKTDDNAGISLVMSPALTAEPIAQSFKDVHYNLFDVSFRMDCVNNDGLGDSADFMNVVTEPHEERRETHTWDGQGGNPYELVPFGSPAAMLAGVILGPAALPVAGVAGILSGIIGF